MSKQETNKWTKELNKKDFTTIFRTGEDEEGVFVNIEALELNNKKIKFRNGDKIRIYWEGVINVL